MAKGQKIEPRRFYERWQEPGCRLEKTSELCTFPSRLAAGGGCWEVAGENRRPWSYFQLNRGAGVRPWASHLRSPSAWSRALRETTRVLSAAGEDQGCTWSQAGCTFLPSGSSLSPGLERGAGPGYQLTAARRPAHRMFLRHAESHRWKI